MPNKQLLKPLILMAGTGILAVAAVLFFKNEKKSSISEHTREVLDTTFSLPVMPAVYPALMVKLSDKDTTSVPMKLNTLKMNVEVIGNLVYTTMEMIFYNNLTRDLEGQFYFPLSEGQAVTRFAMEVNNELREGVVVEKAKGRATYESVIRKRIDPGLLEWTKGNNFKARIFPIPAKGYKKLIIGYTHELLATPSTYMYYQPMAFKEPIDNFEIMVKVLQQEEIPLQKDQQGNILKFNKEGESWVTKTNIKNYSADKPIAFEIPETELINKVFVEEIPNTDSLYFYTNIKPQKFEKDKKLPQKIGIIWDVSASGNNRDTKKEIKIIHDYLSVLKNAEIVLIPFANACFRTENIRISNGKCSALNEKLNNMIYDGGTQMGCLDLNSYKVDEFLMFSDGISNFGKQEPAFSNVPVTTFAFSAVADYSFLKYVAQKSNGQFINTIGEDAANVVAKLQFQPYRYKHATVESGNAFAIFPSMPTGFNRNFSLAGKMKGNAAEIKVNFGFGSENVKDYVLKIDKQHKVAAGTLSRAWAQKKLDELDILPEKNADAITSIGLKYSLITRHTSLLVLDRLEDYVEHKILPPPGKMRKEYMAMVTREKQDEQKLNKEHLEEVVTMFNERKEWWNLTFDWPKEEEKKTENKSGLQLEEEVVANAERASSQDSFRTDSVSSVSSFWSFGQGAGAASATHFSPPHNFTFNSEQTRNVYLTPGTFQVHLESGNDNPSTDIELKTWEPDAPYMKPLKNAPKNKLYQTYIKLKAANKNTPAYYFDVSDIMINKGMKDEALRVLSNIAELELENHELLRTLAHRLQQLKKYDLAVDIYKDVLKIREEEPQSYRDLGLAYADNKEYQKAVDMLCKLINKRWDGRFPEIEVIAVGEVNNIIAKSPNKLNLSALDQRLRHNLKTDVRVVINWDSDNCDMDLWVTDPTGEKTYYSNTLSAIGGKISKDFTGGYGPEEFIIKKAMPGKYLVQVDYFGSSRQTVSGPTTVQAILITSSGTRYEKRKEVTIRLKNEKEVIDIGELVF